MTTIRPATPADLDGVVSVFRACWTRSYTSFATREELARLDDAASVELWRGALSRPGTTLVAERDGRVIGLTRATRGSDVAQVHSLYVHPDAQGGGVGGRLLAQVTGDAPRAQLWVFTANRQGRAFYAKHGWRPDGVTRVQERFGMAETRLVREPPVSLAQVAARLTSDEVTVCDSEAPPYGAVVGTGRAGIAAAGARNLAGDPVTVSTWFDLASVTKLVTTVALIQLVSAGQVDLGAAAGSYWPPAGDLVVSDLLSHSSGLPAWQPLYAALGPGRQDRDAALRLAVSLPRDEPGRYCYSDLGFMVLGEVVAAVAGRPLPAALRSLVFDPLGVDLRFAADLEGAEAAASSRGDEVERRMVATGEPYPIRFPASFDRWRTYELVAEANDGNCYHGLGGVSGHAGLFGTVAALLGLGGELAAPTVLDAATVEAFTQEGPHPGQALGFRVRCLDDGRRLVYHPGFTGCALGFVPGEQAYAVATNRLLAQGSPIPTDRLLAVLVALGQEAA